MSEGNSFIIGGRRLTPDEPPYMVAEISANHGGSLEMALEAIQAAKTAGADAVKFQTYTPDTMTIDHDGPSFRIHGGLWDGRSLYDLYREAHTPWEWHPQLFAKAREIGLQVFSTPFDASAVDFLETLDPPAYKIASFELIDLALIDKVARTGRPIILSTGMASLGEIETAVKLISDLSHRKPLLLHCVSGYPAPADEFNLHTLGLLRSAFGTEVGLSDHSKGMTVPIAATALGAMMIEKHFTTSRSLGGPDADFSAEPHEFATMAEACRTAWASLGVADVARTSCEAGNTIFRRSLYVVADVCEGETFTAANLRSIRPGDGLPPALLNLVTGQAAAQDIRRGTPLSLDLVRFHRKP